MTKKAPELSLPLFHFDKSYWCPTLDISRFVTYDHYNTDRLIRLEEWYHRIIFLPTQTRLWMAWIEFLSNIEFVSVIEQAKNLQMSGAKFSLSIPLSICIQNQSIPMKLKLRINDLYNACQAINLLKVICEPIIESLTIPRLERTFRDEPLLKQMMIEIEHKKIETYGLANLCTMTRKLQKTVGSAMGYVSNYIFGPITQSKKAFPSITLNCALEDFNAPNFQWITKRFYQVLYYFGLDNSNAIFRKAIFNRFKKKLVNVPTAKIIDHYLLTISSIIEDLSVISSLGNREIFLRNEEASSLKKTENEMLNKEEIQRMKMIIQLIIPPLFSSSVFWEQIVTHWAKKMDIDPWIHLGNSPVYVEEDLVTGSEEMFLAKPELLPEVTSRLHISESLIPMINSENFLVEGILNAHDVTDLKYFFLTGKWARLLEKTENKNYFKEILLENLQFEPRLGL